MFFCYFYRGFFLRKDILMQENYNNLIKKEEIKFSNNIEKWHKRHECWSEVQNLIQKEFKKFEKLINSSKIYKVYSLKTDLTVQLSFGQLPVGKTLNSQKEIEMEKGSAIVYSKGIDGKICCLIYNCYSNQMTPCKKWFIYKIYSDPSKISEKEIYKALKTFLMCTRNSSCTQETSIIEKIKYWYHSSFYDWFLNIFSFKTLTRTAEKLIEQIPMKK